MELTTPQQYPLSLNALLAACNQSSNRDPVMSLEEDEVRQALDELKEERLVRFVLPSHGRSVVRYRHVLDETLGLDRRGAALVALLVLRGPQTAGELRGRSERMADFDSLAAVEHELERLAEADPPLVVRLARRPGQKEERWRHLLGEDESAATPDPPEHDPVGADRGSDLAGIVSELRAEVRTLAAELDAQREALRAQREALDALRGRLGD